MLHNCTPKTINPHKHRILTFSVSHKQHSVVNHPGVAEDLPGVRNTFLVELKEDNYYFIIKIKAGCVRCLQFMLFTCIPNAFRATETGPFSASQAAISERSQITIFV